MCFEPNSSEAKEYVVEGLSRNAKPKPKPKPKRDSKKLKPKLKRETPRNANNLLFLNIFLFAKNVANKK